MKWEVAWRRSARDDLARLWLDPDLRSAVTAAANQIDRLLAKDPLAVGESRDKNRRVLIELPLGVIYKVKSGERKLSSPVFGGSCNFFSAPGKGECLKF